MLNVFENKYKITYNDSDFTGRLSIAKLGNFILDTAGLHAAELGISMRVLAEKKMTWVISGLHFAFFDLPETGTVVSVETEITGCTKITCKRDFHIVSEGGRRVADISSEWLVINALTRRPVFLDEVFKDFSSLVNSNCGSVEKYKHLRFLFQDGAEVLKYRVMYSDIDINAHLYSMRYLEIALNMLGAGFFKTGKILSADLNFVSEVLYNQEVEMYYEKSSPQVCRMEMRRDGKPVFRAEFQICSDKN